MKNKKIVLVLMMFAIFSCQHKTKNKNSDTPINEESHVTADQQDNQHWTYEGETGPKHWAEIEKQSDCDGNSQSPINIIDINVVDGASLKSIDIHYSNNIKIHEVTNDGHTIQYNFDIGDYIMLNDEKHELKQIHFQEAQSTL